MRTRNAWPDKAQKGCKQRDSSFPLRDMDPADASLPYITQFSRDRCSKTNIVPQGDKEYAVTWDLRLP